MALVLTAISSDHAAASMERRSFIAALALGLAGVPCGVAGQPSARVYRVGVLCGIQCGGPLLDVFRQRLAELGWVEGRNLTLEYRAAAGRYEELPGLANELLRLNVDVVLAAGATTAVPAAKSTASVPVVFFGVTDPVKVGIVDSLAHPGGNVTGLTLTTTYEYWAKLLEFLKAVVPTLRRLGVLSDIQEDRPNWQPILEEAGRTLGVEVIAPTMVRRREDFPNAIDALTARKAGGVIVTMAAVTYLYRAEIVERLVRARLPMIGIVRELPEAGGLLSYGTELRAIFARLAEYVDRILRGAKPGELPVEQPTKFELVVNRKTARALGLTVPQSLLLRADRVIE